VKRILIVQEYIPQYRAKLFVELKAKLATKGLDLVILAGRPSVEMSARQDAGSASNYRRIWQYEFRILGRRLNVRGIPFNLIRSSDLIILEQARRNIDLYFLIFFRRFLFPKLKIALWGHGHDFTKSTTRIEKYILKSLTRNVDWFFSYTQKSSMIVQEYGFNESNITLLQNSADVNPLIQDISNITLEETQKFKLDTFGSSGPLALYMGALDVSKKISFLIESLDLVYSQRPDFRLAIAGAGPMSEKVSSLAVSRPWLKLMGPQFGRTKALLLKSAEMLVIPGRVGLVTIDSFAAGCPIVTTDDILHPPEFDYLENERNALVVREDEVEFSQAVISLFDVHLHNRLSSNCRKDLDGHSLDKMIANFATGILACLGSRF